VNKLSFPPGFALRGIRVIYASSELASLELSVSCCRKLKKTYTSPFLPVEMEHGQAEDHHDCCWLEVNAMTKPMKVWKDQLAYEKEKS